MFCSGILDSEDKFEVKGETLAKKEIPVTIRKNGSLLIDTCAIRQRRKLSLIRSCTPTSFFNKS